MLAGGGQLSCNSRMGQIKNAPSECSGSYHIRHSYRMGPATTTTAASGRCREELLGQRPARRTCRPRHARMLGAATRRTNQSPAGALVAVLCTAALFDSRTGQIKNALAQCAKATTILDIPSRWDPRTKQQSTGLLFATCRWPCCSIPIRVKLKIPRANARGIFMTRTGIEPMLQP